MMDEDCKRKLCSPQIRTGKWSPQIARHRPGTTEEYLPRNALPGGCFLFSLFFTEGNCYFIMYKETNPEDAVNKYLLPTNRYRIFIVFVMA
ncbi:hypothetical protein AVEN_201585-1 [Araneus ventricosus]|uniref:Uncharacterized protein n=1 Tax=Araneus ventricosus TaxID=182803 RepID=A0A4Y2FE02_ARAVE|nr:hypothetical protein AVEN_201585-1 [Araneus ventricosus]